MPEKKFSLLNIQASQNDGKNQENNFDEYNNIVFADKEESIPESNVVQDHSAIIKHGYSMGPYVQEGKPSSKIRNSMSKRI